MGRVPMLESLSRWAPLTGVISAVLGVAGALIEMFATTMVRGPSGARSSACPSSAEMIATDTVYASGTWIVTKGREEEFVRRWTEFLQWTRSTFGELGTAQLIRDEETAGHFVSFAT